MSKLRGMLSFVIPAHNEDSLIKCTIRALQDAMDGIGGEYEIIVANDGSTDRTAGIATAAGARVVEIDRRQIAAARNAGARAARGDVFIFVDADTFVPEATIRGALAAMSGGAAGGGASARFDNPVPGYARILLPVFNSMFRIANLASGCFLFCRRNAFERFGGFDETLFASEEIAFCRAVKRCGRFVRLHEFTITSGRKLRHFRGRELLGMVARGAFRPSMLTKREGLEIWYGEGLREPGPEPWREPRLEPRLKPLPEPIAEPGSE